MTFKSAKQLANALYRMGKGRLYGEHWQDQLPDGIDPHIEFPVSDVQMINDDVFIVPGGKWIVGMDFGKEPSFAIDFNVHDGTADKVSRQLAKGFAKAIDHKFLMQFVMDSIACPWHKDGDKCRRFCPFAVSCALPAYSIVKG